MATTFMKALNNAVTALNGNIIAADLTILVVASSVFPTTYPFPISIDNEILSVTNNNTGTNTITVTRAQESTSAASHSSGAAVAIYITAKYITDLNTAVNALEGGIAGNLDDTAGGTDALTTKAPTSNAFYDHTQAADPHTGYRLESADHTHATTGAQAGQLDHGLAMVAASLLDDDHTQYVLKTLFDAYTVLMATTDNTPVALTVGEQTIVGRITGGVIAALTVAQLQTLWGSAALPENVEILLTAALSADGKYSGITENGTAGAILAFGDEVYLQTADSKWELASADNAAAGCSFKLGMCVLAAAENAATKVLLIGKIRADAAFPVLTIGAPVYMGIVAGDVQVAAPTATTDVVRIIGYGNTADELFFNPSQDWFEKV